jgi:DNA-binding transcriptional ArsR family regulator
MKRDIFQAIADPTRRAILVLLAGSAMTPNALAEHFDTTRQAVSKHIQVLVECDLLRQEKNGREIYYHFNPGRMQEIDKWLQQFRQQWEDRFSQLDKVLLNFDSNHKNKDNEK